MHISSKMPQTFSPAVKINYKLSNPTLFKYDCLFILVFLGGRHRIQFSLWIRISELCKHHLTHKSLPRNIDLISGKTSNILRSTPLQRQEMLLVKDEDLSIKKIN